MRDTCLIKRSAQYLNVSEASGPEADELNIIKDNNFVG
jgi:hypothetical protein